MGGMGGGMGGMGGMLGTENFPCIGGPQSVVGAILAPGGIGRIASVPFGSGGTFRIPPRKVGCLRVRTACLDESKPEPTPGMVYEVCRLEELTDRPAVQKLGGMLGDVETDPQAVQAAVWHLKCNLPWPRLAARLRRLGGPHGTQRFFTPQQVEEAKQLAEVAMR
jgi:hypothetical protein